MTRLCWSCRTSAIVAVILGPGCATQNFTLSQALASYQTATPCCQFFGGIAFGQLSSAPETAVLIAANSPAYNFPSTGLSYFAAFELPQSAAGKTLSVQSKFIDDANGSNVRDLFFPVLMLLDQQKNPILVTNGEIGGSISEAMVSPDNKPFVESRIDLRQYPSARYLILFTRPDLFGKNLTINLTLPGGVIAAGRVMVMAPPVTYNDPVRASPVAPRGALTIDLNPA